MTTRLEIIDELATDLRNNLNPDVDSDFNTKIYGGVRVGVFDPDDFSTLPALGIWAIDDDVEDDLMDNVILRRLNMIAYGYVDANTPESYVSFYRFIEDVELFLYSTYNRRYENTYLGKVVITYGGSTSLKGLFVINFSIIYSQSGLES